MPSETFSNRSYNRLEISAWYKNYINSGILRNFYVHSSFLRYSGTWLKKWLKFVLCMKTKSNGRYDVTFKSIFPIWDILEHELQKGWYLCFVWNLHPAYDITQLFPLVWNSPCRVEGASHQEVSYRVRQREELNWASQLKSSDQQIFSTMSGTDSPLIRQD